MCIRDRFSKIHYEYVDTDQRTPKRWILIVLLLLKNVRWDGSVRRSWLKERRWWGQLERPLSLLVLLRFLGPQSPTKGGTKSCKMGFWLG